MSQKFMERKYLHFLSCFPTWNKSLWFVDTSLYYKICLVSWDLLGALKETKACDNSGIFQYNLSEVLGGKRRMLLDTAVWLSSTLTSARVESYSCLKSLRFASALNFLCFICEKGKGVGGERENLQLFQLMSRSITCSSQTSTVLGCYSKSANLQLAEIQL